MIRFIVLACFLCSCSYSTLKGQLSEQAELSILTIRPGADIYAMYGHTAIRLQDPVLKMDVIYNYGVFDFDEPNFVMKFLRGKLLYKLAKSSYPSFIRQYTYQKRSVFEQKLDLTLEETNKLYTALEENYLPKNRNYLYDFFFDNCSTRQRDILKSYLPLLDYPKTSPKPYTYRTLLDEYTYAWPWTDFGQDLLVGTIADRPADVEGQMYLPEFFHQYLERSTLTHRPLVKSNVLLLDFEKEAKLRSQTPWPLPAILFSLLLLFELYLFTSPKLKSISTKWLIWYDHAWFGAVATGSLVLLIMWFGTDHLTTKKNLNLAWMSPLYFWILFNKGRSIILMICFLTLMGLLLSPWIQSLHPCSIIISAILFLKLIRYLKQQYRESKQLSSV